MRTIRHPGVIEELRERIRGVETARVRADEPGVSTGFARLDQLFPSGGLTRGTLIEWLGDGDGSGAGTLAMAIAAHLLRDRATFVVIDESAEFHPVAAAQLGIPLDQTVVVRPPDSAAALWAWEQALRCPGVAVTFGRIGSANDRVFRRFQVGVEAGGGWGFLMRSARVRVGTFMGGHPRLCGAGVRRWFGGVAWPPAAQSGSAVAEVGLVCQPSKWICLMKRVLCLWLPNWPVQWRYVAPPRDKAPALVVHAPAERGKVHVIACCRTARRRGVRSGMLLAEAQSLWPMSAASSVRFEPHDPSADRQHLRELARGCLQFSPTVGIDTDESPDCLLVDATGCGWGPGGEEEFAASVVAFADSRGYRAVAAVAGTVGAAWAVAHFGMSKYSLAGSR